MKIRIVCLAYGAVLFALTGCGGGGTTVEGHVEKGGKPLSFAEGEGLTVNLLSEDGKTSASGAVGADGKFTIKHGDEPVPYGKYNVSFVHYFPGKGSKSVPPQNKSVKEPWDVSSSNHTFTLDLDKP